MIYLSDYKNALDYCKSFFQNELSGFEVYCLVLFGSAIYPGCFRKTSDLDILAMTNLATNDRLNELADKMMDLPEFEKSQKRPTVLRDYAGDRIEFSLEYQGLTLDCTIMSSLIPDYETMQRMAAHDFVDVLIGAIIKQGVSFMGDKAMMPEVDFTITPYYDDYLRRKRLNVIESYLASKVVRIREMILDHDSGLIDYYFRYREVFLKWFFGYYRTYPVNLHKHLNYQLSGISELSQEERNIILLVKYPSILKSICSFVDLYEQKKIESMFY